MVTPLVILMEDADVINGTLEINATSVSLDFIEMVNLVKVRQNFYLFIF